MSKRITTWWYVIAWVVWATALFAPIALGRSGRTTDNVVMTVAGLVAFVMWIGALLRLAQQRAWGWFVAVFVLQLFFLGIVGMVSYAIAGPEDTEDVAIRPSTT